MTLEKQKKKKSIPTQVRSISHHNRPSPSTFLPSGAWPSNCTAPSAPLNQQTRSFTYCSTLGFSTVSCKSKSSTVPILVINKPGKPDEILYMRVPQTEQKWFSIVLPDSMVLFWENLVSASRPRVCVASEARTMKLDANMEAVILRQSAQEQTKVSTRPGAVVGWVWLLLR